MTVRVPLLDLKAQYDTIRPEIAAALARVLESQHFILGPEVEAFERWSQGFAPLVMGSDATPELSAEFARSLRRYPPEVAYTVFTAAFRSDFFSRGGLSYSMKGSGFFVELPLRVGDTELALILGQDSRHASSIFNAWPCL